MAGLTPTSNKYSKVIMGKIAPRYNDKFLNVEAQPKNAYFIEQFVGDNEIFIFDNHTPNMLTNQAGKFAGSERCLIEQRIK